MLLTDDQWILIEGLILESNSATNRHSTSPERERIILECILWKLASGTPWIDLPDIFLKVIMKSFPNRYASSSNRIFKKSNLVFPSQQTVYRRYRKWLKSGLIRKVFSILISDLQTRGEFPLHRAMSEGYIRIEYASASNLALILDPKVSVSWQIITALLILGIIARQMNILK